LVADQVSRGHRVRLEQEPAQAPSKFRQPQSLALAGHQNHSYRFANVLLAFRPRNPAIGANPRRKTDPSPKEFSLIDHAFFAFSPGTGKQIKKNGIHRKIMSSRLTMIISNNSAHIVMIGIDSEHTIPISRPLDCLHGPFSGIDKSLWNGHGNTDSTRSPNDNPFTRSIWPHNMSEIMKAAFLSNFLRPAGDVSRGNPIRIGLAGASGSKKLAI